MSLPKAHHYVSQMQLRYFADQNGKLFYYNKKSPNRDIQYDIVKNLFFQNHLYDYEKKDKTKDVSLELQYSKEEGEAKKIIDKIVKTARLGDNPNLSVEEREKWDLFFYNQWRRTPDMHGQYFDDKNFKKVLDEAREHFETKFRPYTPEEKEMIKNPQWIKKFKQRVKVEALKKPGLKVQKALKDKGICVAIITKPNKSFIIGSNPVIKLAHKGKSNLDDPTVEVWLPIAPDIAVSPAPFYSEKVVELKEDRHIRSINGAILKQSSLIASSNKSLIASLTKYERNHK